MKFILFTDGVLTARYTSDIHGDNIPVEAIEVSNELFTKTINEQDGIWVLDGVNIVKNPLPEITLEQTIAQFEAGIQSHLDISAQEQGYDNILTACSYAAAPNPYQAESITFVTWRGNVWAYCYSELQKVISGTRPMPLLSEIISELPVR